MTDFQIHFTNPWLLLLLIPAFGLVLLPYFRLSKRYRRTRNRICSVILHITVSVFAVMVLSGLYFTYDKPNPENELIILVDESYSNSADAESKGEFIKDVIRESGTGFKVGVVSFGYDQVYAVPLTDKTDGIYEQYLKADKPRTDATDVASALEFARGKFTSPSSGKILLISDGLETDGNAITAVKALVSDGIKVDTACFGSVDTGNEAMIFGAETPDYHISVGDLFQVGLNVKSSYAGTASVTMHDSVLDPQSGGFTPLGEAKVSANLKEGEQTVNIQHTFDLPGMHRLFFSLESSGDTLDENNGYYTFIDLEVFDRILIVQRSGGEADLLRQALKERYETVDVVDINDAENMPTTLDGLRAYDQIIMLNIGNPDMPEGFDKVLYSYVNDIGGGLFTVGGNRINEKTGETEANTYNRTYMRNTLYQELLPVEAIKYTPPLGAVVVIDRSGSMNRVDGKTGKTLLELAKEGAASCLNAMTERDYYGVITLESTYGETLQLTPVTEEYKIIAAIDSIKEAEGTTMYEPSIRHAGRALAAADKVQKKHMIIVTDGAPSDEADKYKQAIEENAANGITCSMVIVGEDASADSALKSIIENSGHGHYYAVRNLTELSKTMREDLNVKEIKDMTFGDEGITPKIGSHTSVMSGALKLIGEGEKMPDMYGYYGTKLKDDEGITTPLMIDFVPLFAQWKFGNGSVGSFMSDLSGDWSKDFLASSVGKEFLYGAINSLLPIRNIRANDIEVWATEDNFHTQISVSTALNKKETLEITMTAPSDDDGNVAEQKVAYTADDNYSRTVFENLQPGLHKIAVRKLDAEGNVISENSVYRSFSYSEEYDVFLSAEDGAANMKAIARSGYGKTVTEAAEVFESAERFKHYTVDPRVILLILALILFLSDIAVRKFKFKWPHEIIRDYKEKKAAKNEQNGSRRSR